MSLITSPTSSSCSINRYVPRCCRRPCELLKNFFCRRNVSLEQPKDESSLSATSRNFADKKREMVAAQEKINSKMLASTVSNEATLHQKKSDYNRVLPEEQVAKKFERIQSLASGKTYQSTEFISIPKVEVADNERNQQKLKNDSNNTLSENFKSQSEENGKKATVAVPKIETLEDLVRELPSSLKEISISYLGPKELQKYERELTDSIIKLLKNNPKLSSEMEKSALSITTMGIYCESRNLSMEQRIKLINYCKNIKFLSLSYLATSAVMKAIFQLKNLYSLDISHSKEICDDDLIHITELLSLNKLELNCCRKISNAGLVHLAKLINLYKLDLCECNRITDDGLAVLANLFKLQKLDLTLCNEITNDGLAYLSELVCLRSLKLSFCTKITGNGLIHIAKLKNLKELYLDGCKGIVKDVGLAPLAQLRNLKKLNVASCDITDDNLKIIAQIENLEELDLSYCKKITNAGASEIVKLRNLKKLNLEECEGIKKDGFIQVLKLENLEELRLSYSAKSSTIELDESCSKKLKIGGSGY